MSGLGYWWSVEGLGSAGDPCLSSQSLCVAAFAQMLSNTPLHFQQEDYAHIYFCLFIYKDSF